MSLMIPVFPTSSPVRSSLLNRLEALQAEEAPSSEPQRSICDQFKEKLNLCKEYSDLQKAVSGLAELPKQKHSIFRKSKPVELTQEQQRNQVLRNEVRVRQMEIIEDIGTFSKILFNEQKVHWLAGMVQADDAYCPRFTIEESYRKAIDAYLSGNQSADDAMNADRNQIREMMAFFKGTDNDTQNTIIQLFANPFYR